MGEIRIGFFCMRDMLLVLHFCFFPVLSGEAGMKISERCHGRGGRGIWGNFLPQRAEFMKYGKRGSEYDNLAERIFSAGT